MESKLWPSSLIYFGGVHAAAVLISTKFIWSNSDPRTRCSVNCVNQSSVGYFRVRSQITRRRVTRFIFHLSSLSLSLSLFLSFSLSLFSFFSFSLFLSLSLSVSVSLRLSFSPASRSEGETRFSELSPARPGGGVKLGPFPSICRQRETESKRDRKRERERQKERERERERGAVGPHTLGTIGRRVVAPGVNLRIQTRAIPAPRRRRILSALPHSPP